MSKSHDMRKLAGERLRELFPRASDWEEHPDFRAGVQPVDLLVRFKLGVVDHAVIVETTSLGQPRQIRAAMTRLGELRRELPGAYAVAVAPYISAQSASLLKKGGLGYLDLSGNCHLSFDNVLIEKEGKPNTRPSTRPLRSLFAPRATRVVRVLLVDAQHPWGLEDLAKAAEVSLGHCHNVVKRLEELSWVERRDHQRIHLVKPGDLLEGWTDSYSHRVNDIEAFFSPERITRKLAGELGRVCHAEGRRYAFTLHSGAALVASNVRFPALHCYVEGSLEPIVQSLGLRAGVGEGNVYLLAPYDEGVFYSPITKSGLAVVCLPQLYADLYHYEPRGREQATHLRRETMGY